MFHTLLIWALHHHLSSSLSGALDLLVCVHTVDFDLGITSSLSPRPLVLVVVLVMGCWSLVELLLLTFL